MRKQENKNTFYSYIIELSMFEKLSQCSHPTEKSWPQYNAKNKSCPLPKNQRHIFLLFTDLSSHRPVPLLPSEAFWVVICLLRVGMTSPSSSLFYRKSNILALPGSTSLSKYHSLKAFHVAP